MLARLVLFFQNCHGLFCITEYTTQHFVSIHAVPASIFMFRSYIDRWQTSTFFFIFKVLCKGIKCYSITNMPPITPINTNHTNEHIWFVFLLFWFLKHNQKYFVAVLLSIHSIYAFEFCVLFLICARCY